MILSNVVTAIRSDGSFKAAQRPELGMPQLPLVIGPCRLSLIRNVHGSFHIQDSET
jgi:hypothetical protein